MPPLSSHWTVAVATRCSKASACQLKLPRQSSQRHRVKKYNCIHSQKFWLYIPLIFKYVLNLFNPVPKLLDNYHERLNDEGEPEKMAKRNLTQLEGLRLEHFSTERYVQLNQQLIMGTLTRETNHFRTLDLTNVRVADVESEFRNITLDGDDGRYDVPGPSCLEIIMDDRCCWLFKRRILF